MLADDFQTLDLIGAMYRVQARTQAQLDVIRSRNLIAELRDAAQLIFKVDDGQLTGKGCQIQRFLDRTVCTADDIDVLSGIRSPSRGAFRPMPLSASSISPGIPSLRQVYRRLPE